MEKDEGDGVSAGGTETGAEKRDAAAVGSLDGFHFFAGDFGGEDVHTCRKIHFQERLSLIFHREFNFGERFAFGGDERGDDGALCDRGENAGVGEARPVEREGWGFVRLPVIAERSFERIAEERAEIGIDFLDVEALEAAGFVGGEFESALAFDEDFAGFAQRETGEVLVEGQGTLELAAHESGGLKRLDIKEINPYLRALFRYSLEAAFRYHRQPDESPTLALDWTRFPDASVLAAVAERAVVTTLVTSEGKSLTEIKLTVKNQAQPFLKVDLPAGVNILTAEVAGEKVKPVQGADGSRVPLLRTGFRPAGAYTVSFVFLHSGSPFAKKGDAGLSLPKMDIPISILEWEVFLPEQYKVKDFGGDALSASYWPTRLEVYAKLQNVGTGEGSGVGGGSFQAGVGIGGLPENSRNITSLMSLSPGFALAPNQLGGVVIDPSGALISSAIVEVKNLSTNATWSASTSSDGRWLLPNVPSGTYQLPAHAPGFQTMHSTISYDASNPHAYQIGLNVGSVTQTVEVTAEASTIETSTAQISGRKKNKNAAAPPPPPASANVYNLQQRVAGVLPVAVDIPRAGASYRFLRPLVLNEETKLSFAYKSK